MAEHRVGIIMNGVTGRMGTNQHLIRSILAIRADGGITLSDGTRVLPDPFLVGRNPEKLQRLGEQYGVERWSTDLDTALESKDNEVYFDAATTELRAENVQRAIAAGKHIYCEKPVASSLKEALKLRTLAEQAGIKHGVVQDKLFLPGLLKLRTLRDSGFFGRILSVRIEFGYWVFEGNQQPAQRPSWNYRKEDGGGIIIDMLCHWRYVLDNLFGEVKSVSCLGTRHIPQRWDEQQDPYEATADDAAYATFELEGGIIAQVNSSWCTRVRRDDLVTFHVDGTRGSAVAGLMDCVTQSLEKTPRPIWSPDTRQSINLTADWDQVPDDVPPENGFRVQWEMFLRYLFDGGEWRHTLLEGAKGLQLAELGLQSWKERRWIDVPPLEI